MENTNNQQEGIYAFGDNPLDVYYYGVMGAPKKTTKLKWWQSSLFFYSYVAVCTIACIAMIVAAALR